MRAWRIFLLLFLPAAVAFIAFVFGYPRVFPAVDRAHFDHYRENAADLVESGRPERAIRVVAHAAASRRDDPGAWALLGDLHRDAGDRAAAWDAYRHAIAVTQTMTSRPTDRPLYHSHARLGLAEIALRDGDWTAALGHLEFARRFLDEDPEPYAALYDELGLPQRAAALRGAMTGTFVDAVEWIELDAIRQFRPWDPCQLRLARLGMYADGRVSLETQWSSGEPMALATAMNAVPMEILSRLDAALSLGDDAPDALPVTIPGWRTTPHLWSPGSRVAIEPGSGGQGPVILIERTEPGNALLTTLPVKADGGMFVAVRVRSEGAPTSIAWIARDERESVSFQDTFTPVPPGDWTWHAAYHPASEHWADAALQIGLYQSAGRVLIDRVVMFVLPDAPCAR